MELCVTHTLSTSKVILVKIHVNLIIVDYENADSYGIKLI